MIFFCICNIYRYANACIETRLYDKFCYVQSKNTTLCMLPQATRSQREYSLIIYPQFKYLQPEYLPVVKGIAAIIFPFSLLLLFRCSFFGIKWSLSACCEPVLFARRLYLQIKDNRL